ncbi:MAG: amidohydrolase family protein [Phenylobacterium sp.]
MRVDAHHHLWRIARGDYHWLSKAEFPILYRDFMPDDFALLLAAARIDRTILVQAAETVAETEFLLAIAEATPFVGGVVGWVDFTAVQAPAQIDRLAGNPRLVGMRPMLQDLPDSDWILRDEVQPAIRALAAHGLRFDALVRPAQLPAIRRLLDRYPDLPVVIDHGAKPPIAAGELDDWACHMRAIARDSRAVCKLSGLPGEAPPGWTVETLRPYADVLIEAFGPARLMFGSDWPVLNLSGDYAGWLTAAEALTAGLSKAEQAQVFGGVAASFYGLA